MKWIKLASAYYLDPAVVALDDAAEVMFTRALAYCGQAESDGFIPDQVIPMLSRRQRGAAKVAAKLVLAGLIEPVSGGYRVIKWEIWQTTNDDLEAKREAGKKRIAKHRERQREAATSDNADQGSSGNAVTPPATDHAGNAVTQPPCNALVTPLEVEESRELVPNGTNVSRIASEPAREDVTRLCEHLADRIEANGSKRPQVTKSWQDAARLMLDRDERTEHQVHTAIDWCQDDEFWRGNVLSMPKLRAKYDQLRLQAQRSTATTTAVIDRRQQATNDLFDRAMARAQAKEANAR